MRQELRLVAGSIALPEGTLSARLAPGDQISRVVQSEAGTLEPFEGLAARLPAYWWLFDPHCIECANNAITLGLFGGGPNESVPFVALALSDPVTARTFLDQYGVRAPVYTIETKIPAQFRSVPQFFKVDRCGTVTHIFYTQADFVANLTKGE